jgi:hypothetical protein
MPDYRFYKIGDDGHVVSLRVERTFDDDATAIAYAEQLADTETIEIWEGTARSHFVLMDEADGQLHTRSVLEQLREASKGLWGASYTLAPARRSTLCRGIPFAVLIAAVENCPGSAAQVADC